MRWYASMSICVGHKNACHTSTWMEKQSRWNKLKDLILSHSLVANSRVLNSHIEITIIIIISTLCMPFTLHSFLWRSEKKKTNYTFKEKIIQFGQQMHRRRMASPVRRRHLIYSLFFVVVVVVVIQFACVKLFKLQRTESSIYLKKPTHVSRCIHHYLFFCVLLHVFASRLETGWITAH